MEKAYYFLPCVDVGDDVGEGVGLVDGERFELSEGEGVTMLLGWYRYLVTLLDLM